MVIADAPAERTRASSLRSHLVMAVVAIVIYGALHAMVGRIPVSDGLGWDGRDYGVMLVRGWERGGVNTALRPLIVWLAQPAYALTQHVVNAFDFTNYVYVGLLAFLFSRVMERYGASLRTCAVAIVCLNVSHAYQMSAYYPATIDLGGHAFMTLALWQIIAGPRWAAAAASVAAVLSREYAPIVLVFGVMRDLRMRVPIRKIVMTFLPAALVYVALRVYVLSTIGEGNSLQTFVDNLYYWDDPMFAALYVYFSLTAIAGISLVVAAQPRRWWSVIREEPEWLGLALPLVAVTAFVGIDIWRYLAALTPLALVLLTRCSQEWRPRETVVFLTAIVALTLLTQMPFQGMDLTRYFVDLFPYYIWIDEVPADLAGLTRDLLWPAWGWRFLAVMGSFLALVFYANGRSPLTGASPLTGVNTPRW